MYSANPTTASAEATPTGWVRLFFTAQNQYFKFWVAKKTVEHRSTLQLHPQTKVLSDKSKDFSSLCITLTWVNIVPALDKKETEPTFEE